MNITSLVSVIPKLPSRNIEITKEFYLKAGFRQVGDTYPDYLMLMRDKIEIHFFLFKDLQELENYGMCYVRVDNIDTFYNELSEAIPNTKRPEVKPWRQKEFSITDPDHNCLTFGEGI